MTDSPHATPGAAAPALEPSQITGLLLAGGRGARMGGADKGLLEVRGRPLAEHVLQRLRPQVGALLVSANRNPVEYARLGATVLADDDPTAFAGPLAGIAAGLRACATPWLLSVPCDAPFLPADLARRLAAAALAQAQPAAVAHAAGRRQPVFALLRRELLPDLLDFLRGGEHKVETWLARVGFAEAAFDDPACFDNINLPRQLDALRTRAAARSETSPMPPPSPARPEPMLSVAQARELLLQLPVPDLDVRMVPLHKALHRVLARDLMAPFDVPAHDNAAMDGYALRSAELHATGDTTLRIAGCGLAGHAFTGDLPAGAAVRIMTGAVLPADCDTVVPQELCRTGDTDVVIPAGVVRAGANVRRRGEDLAAGRPALAGGRLLRAADLGLAASLGVGELAVRRRLRVAFLSSGDELRSIGQSLDPGSIYDSNRHTLRAMLVRLGCEPVDLGLVPDDPARIEAALLRGCEQADVVISSGGMGLGDADHLGRTLARLGDVAFRDVAMRPGRPLACGVLRCGTAHTVLVGLPGNPVAVMVTFYVLVRDLLLRLMGTQADALPRWPVLAAQPLRKRPGRTEFQRARLQRLADGRWQAVSTGNQGSGVLHSMSQADGFVVLQHERADVAAGEIVEFLPFDALA